MIREPFFRNKAAYLVGRIRFDDHNHLPIVLPILTTNENKLYVDACLVDVDAVSILFASPVLISWCMRQPQPLWCVS